MVYYSLLTVVRRQNCGPEFFHTKWQIIGKIDITYAIYRKNYISLTISSTRKGFQKCRQYNRNRHLATEFHVFLLFLEHIAEDFTRKALFCIDIQFFFSQDRLSRKYFLSLPFFSYSCRLFFLSIKSGLSFTSQIMRQNGI